MKKLYDPIELSIKTEKIVCNGNKRKYLKFNIAPDYGRGIAMGYVAGCNLRCVFCAASKTRDNLDIAKSFYSPEEVFDILYKMIKKHPLIEKARISDGEPTIGREHLLELIELFEKSDVKRFHLETNGIILGNDESYIRDLSRFKKLTVRVSLKGGTPEGFSKITNAIPESFELPFQAIRNLIKNNITCSVAAMSADPRIMNPIERMSLISKVGMIDPALALKMEEEVTVLFPNARRRLELSGLQIGNIKRPFFLRNPIGNYFQVSYKPVQTLMKKKISLRYTLRNIRQLLWDR